MLLRKLKIGSRLGLGFGVILGVMIVVSVGGTALGKKSRDDLSEVIAAASSKEADRRRHEVARARAVERDAQRGPALGPEVDADGRRPRQAPRADVRRGPRPHDQDEPRAAERDILATLAQIDKDVELPFKQAMAMSTSFRNEDAAQIIMNELDPTIQKSLFELGRLIELQKKANQEAVANATQTGDRLAAAVYIVNALVLVLAGLVAWAMTRSIAGPMRESGRGGEAGRFRRSHVAHRIRGPRRGG
jgi:methyl-accepting chemotaxis protein